MLTDKDISQLNLLGINKNDFEKQIGILIKGAQPADIIKPALVGRGILKLTPKEEDELRDLWRQESKNYKISKFVPASGAATRMFKDFYAYLSGADETQDVTKFFENLSGFAFSEDLPPLKSDRREDKEKLLSLILNSPEFNFGALPKGLLPFHLREGNKITPFEEHLTEGALAATSKEVFIHFTVSPQHQSLFETHSEQVAPKLEKKYGVKFNLEYSFQDPSTDTPALNEKGEPFRKEDGSLLLRPGGHGSLIKNLNTLTSDIIFLKNIDNVGTMSYGKLSVKWFTLFGALLITARKELNQAETSLRGNNCPENISSALKTLQKWGGIELKGSETAPQIIELLNRPVRICGMVKNDGDTGGGPFWITDGQGNTTLQVVESAQIDQSAEGIKEKLQGITHFNPVFLACSPKNCQGEKIDLSNHVDETAAFTADKSLNGHPLKALEHPGLWNGSMAFWNTTFVEIPLKCFNPVKSLPDLLGSAHKG